MKHKRILALLMAAVLIMTLLPTPVFSAASEAEEDTTQTSQTEDFLQDLPEIIDAQAAREKGHTQRLRDEEGEHLNKLVFGNADGTKTMYLYDHPVKYRDEQGQIHDISLEIADTNDSAYPFRTRANSAVTEFPASLPDGITLSGNGVDLRISTQLPVGNTALNHFARRVDNNTIAYTYDANTTIEYALTYTGFKEEIVVSSYTGQTEYPFLLYTNGLNLESIDDGYYLTDENGTIQAAIGDIIVFTADERNNTMGTLQVTCLKPGQIYGLTIVLDADYLADPATVYPIRIDPTVQLVYTDENPNAIEEKTIQSNNTTSGSNTATVIGKNSKGISRSLMKFPGMDFTSLEGSVVTSAVVTIRDLMCQEEAMTVTCYPFTGDVWTESSTQWANLTQSWGAALSSNVVSYSSGTQQTTAHRYCFNITSLAQQWVNGTADPAKGIIFRADAAVENASSTLTKTFGTSERASYRPTFEITYIPNDWNVDEGSTITLTTAFPADQTVTWSSANSSIASVDQNGVVTGHLAGKTTITATCTGYAAPVAFTVYVTVADGVYYIKNAASELCLANEDVTVDSTATHIEQQNTSSVTDPTQFWRITYMGNGMYAIRPIDRPLAVLTVNSSGNVIVQDLAENATVQIGNRWEITHNSFGYAFEHKGLSDLTMTPVSASGNGSNVTVAAWASSLNCHWTLETAKGVVLRDQATGQQISADTTFTVELDDVVTLIDLGLTLEVYGACSSLSWNTSEPVAIILEPATIHAVSLGETVITLSASFGEMVFEQYFVFRCIKTVNVEVVYDQAYATRHSNTIARINYQLSQLQEYYLSNFYTQINITSIQQFTSYADENCYSDPNKACDHGERCLDPAYETTEPEPRQYHHKNFANIFWRISYPDISQAFKIAFIGHTVCSQSACNDQGRAPWGLASPRYGFLAVADHRSDIDELITLIHEFGHLIGALDHYGINGWTTEYFNDQQIANAEFHRNCLFGEEHESVHELTDLVICPGCQELIHEKIYSICQGDQEGSGDDDYIELT